MELDRLIEACKNNDRRSQKEIYHRYASKMLGVCRRYVKSLENAEEVLMLGFCKVFTKIQSYTGKGNFEGWIRRIMVNESLMFIRKKYRFDEHVDIQDIPLQISQATVLDELAAQDIIDMMNELPTGYRTVFNLYVIEGYKHKEIAEMLGISINTSKSQLLLAKKKLRSMIEDRQKLINED